VHPCNECVSDLPVYSVSIDIELRLAGTKNGPWGYLKRHWVRSKKTSPSSRPANVSGGTSTGICGVNFPLVRYLLYFYWLDFEPEIDIWWLVWGIFIVAIIERDNLMDESKRWFNMFSLIFELVSAFAGIGLSLGFLGVHNFAYHGRARLIDYVYYRITFPWSGR
jgi:Cation transport protein